MDVTNLDMDVLDGTNYFTWKFDMKNILIISDLYEPTQQKDPPKDINPRSWQVLNLNAVTTITKYLHPRVFRCVSNYTNAYELWERLKDLYELKNTAMNKVILMKKLMGLKYKEGECMGTHIGDFNVLFCQLGELGVSIDEEMQGVMLLATVPLGVLDIICLNNLDKEGKLSLTEIKGYLREKAARKEMEMKELRDKSKGRSKSRGKVVCYYCNKTGHIQKFCWEKKRDKSC